MAPATLFQYRFRFSSRPDACSAWSYDRPTEDDVAEWEEDFREVWVERRTVTFGDVERVEF